MEAWKSGRSRVRVPVHVTCLSTHVAAGNEAKVCMYSYLDASVCIEVRDTNEVIGSERKLYLRPVSPNRYP